MKLIIDTDEKTLTQVESDKKCVFGIYTKEAFEIISHQWLKIGWNQKYSYTFSWMGIPIIQLPEDMFRIHEVIYRIKPDVIIETGIAYGGSLIYYASLCKSMKKGRVIGVDIEIRPNNREAIENHELSSYITLIEGSSTESEIVKHVKSLVKTGETVIVILDSKHTKQHVLDELNAYSSLVSKNSYIVATDGLMKDLFDVPRGNLDWKGDNPMAAGTEFVANNPNFIIEQPKWLFNESKLTKVITHWSSAYLKRIK